MRKLECGERAGDGTEQSLGLQGPDDYARRLANAVAERTRELAEANAELKLRIQEQRQAEHALRESETRYKELADLLPLVVVETNDRGILTFFNRKGLEMTGYTRDEVEDDFAAFQLFSPEDRERAQENFRRMLSGDESVGTEYAALRKDGTTEPILLYSSAIVRDGRPVGLRAVALDVADLKQAEQALRTNEERHRSIVDNVLDAVYTVSPDGCIISLNPAFEAITGWSPSECIGKSFAPLVHPDDLPTLLDSLQRSARGDADRVRQARVLSKSGEYIDMEFAGVPLLQNEKLEGYLGVGRDVTERKRAEQAHREIEERLRNVFDSSLDMIYRLDLRTSEYDFVSPACKQVLGYTPEEYIALGFQGAGEMVHPHDLPGLVDNMIRLLNPAEEPSARTAEYRIEHTELGYRWVSDYRSVVYDEHGAQIAVVGSLRDITDRKQAEDRLRRSEEYFRSLIERASDVVLIVGQDMTVRYMSPSVESTFGYGPEELVGQNATSFVHPDDIERAAEQFARLLQSGGVFEQQEFRVRHANGTWRIAEAVATNLLDHPAIQGVVVNFHDVTERKHAEEELQHHYEQERDLRRQVEAEMKRRVDLTRALAHELKTPLTSVLASSDLLESELCDGPQQGLATNIRQGALNLNQRIDELLDLARGEIGLLELKPESVDISVMLREIADAMVPLASKRSQSLVLSLPLSLPRVQADATRVQQIVTNLLNNALKFTPVGGTVKLGAKQKGSSVVVEVRDTGRGIPKDQHSLIFEPYRRLQNGPSAGLGLGLALCKTLVELHGGQIWVRSTAGKGATFGFSLPVGDADAHTSHLPDNGKRWKVLMIEDDEAIVQFVSVAFRMRWPEAGLISTASGEEGVRLVAAEDPDLVMLDLGLPDTDGFEVLERLRHTSQVPVVIVSVRGEEADRKRGLALGASDYIVKPFKQAELLERLKVQIGEQAARKR